MFNAFSCERQHKNGKALTTKITSNKIKRQWQRQRMMTI